MSSSLENLDWQAEAAALIDDMENYVLSIKISSRHKSDNMRIHFDIETLERNKLLVSMDSSGFRICDRQERKAADGGERAQVQKNIAYGDASEGQQQPQPTGDDHDKVYETINALLDDVSPRYRQAFGQALIDRLQSID